MKMAHDYMLGHYNPDDMEQVKRESFELSENIVKRTLCGKTYKLATQYCEKTYTEYFIRGNEVTENCNECKGAGFNRGPRSLHSIHSINRKERIK